MTRDEIDVMWQQALHQSVQDGEQFTRYRFAALVAANALELADKRIAELESSWVACHAQLAESCDARYKLERKLDVARDELLRCKRIMLHECGIGLVNEVVLAQIGGEDDHKE